MGDDLAPYIVVMPNRSSRKPPPDDPNEAARRLVDQIAEESEDEASPEKNPHAVALGRLGGKKGGPARAAKLSPERRKEIAERAASARWQKAQETAGE